MAQPQMLADIYARQRAEQELQELLNSDQPGQGFKSTLRGAAAAGTSGLLLGSIPALLDAGNVPQRLLREKQREILYQKVKKRAKAEAAEAARAAAAAPGSAKPLSQKELYVQYRQSVDDLFNALNSRHPDRVKEAERLIQDSLKGAKKMGLGTPKVTTSQLLDYAKGVGKGSARAAIPLAILGALGGLASHRKQVNKKKEFLESSGFSKVSSANKSNLSLAHAMCLEFEKIAQTSMGMDPQAGMLAGGVQQGPAPVASEEVPVESAPAHGVVASRVNQLTPKRAIGIPVIQPPPGYVYSPELASFVPNEQDPGWMAQQQAIEAARNKGWYDQGQQDVATQQAQAELDSRADAGIQQAQQEQMQMQQMAQMQQAAQQQAMMAEAQRQGRINADMKSGIVPQPSSGAATKRKPAKKVSGGRGVTIQLGR